MSQRELIYLSTKQSRQYAKECIDRAPDDFLCEIKRRTRTLDQNAKMWAMLGEVSCQVDWYGRKLSAEDWKHVFTASLMQMDTVPGIDGGIVVLGQSTSKMTVAQVRDLIELISAFGADKGVRFHEPDEIPRLLRG